MLCVRGVGSFSLQKAFGVRSKLFNALYIGERGKPTSNGERCQFVNPRKIYSRFGAADPQ